MKHIDQIKIAEAMGYTRRPSTFGFGCDTWFNPAGVVVYHIPDPETDANADYAVLHWMRQQDFDLYQKFANKLYADLVQSPINYTIGTYARIALEIL